MIVLGSLIDIGMAQLNVSIATGSNIHLTFQNYFGDPWNTFDFVIVLGSYTDIIYSELHVSVSSLAIILHTV